MTRPFFAGACMFVLAAAGCIRVDGLPSLPFPESYDPAEAPRDERPVRGGQLTAACEAGEVPRDRAGACLTLARYFQEGVHGFPRDLARAARLWESTVDILQASCESGDVQDCTRTASAMGMRFQPGGLPDPEATGWMIQYAEDGCRGGDPVGCALLGLIYDAGRGTPRDEPRSMAYYDQACGGGHRHSCLHLASRAEGRDAVLAYERACAAGSGFGCAAAAQHHRRGVAVEPDIERAGALFTRGCSLGNLAACVMGAEMYASIEGDEKQRRRAKELAVVACKEGIADGCMLIGELFDREKKGHWAREAYRQACKLGEKRGCDAARAPEGPREALEEPQEALEYESPR